MKTKRALAWLLTLLTVGSTLIACGNPSRPQSDETPNEPTGTAGTVTDIPTDAVTDTRELTDLEIRQSIDDGVGVYDFGGRTFRIVSEESKTLNHYFVNEDNGDPCDTSVLKRNDRIEQRLNIKIDAISINDSLSEMIEMVETGQSVGEIYAVYAHRMYQPVEKHIFYNWYDIPVINLDQPWYNQYSNEQATIKGVLYSLYSSLSITSLTKLCVIFFNERLAENYGIGKQNLYDTVNEGKWTIDRFIELSKDVYQDTNLNNEKDKEDLYGMAYINYEPTDTFLTAFNIPFTEVNDDGTLSFTFETQFDRFVSAADKMREYNMCQGVLLDDDDDPITIFVDGRSVFCAAWLEYCFNEFKDMEDVYQILPYPKWNEEQEGYYTTAQDEYHLYGVPKTVASDDFTFVGAVMEVMSAETYKHVYPVYYENALKGRYSKDPQTAKMVDIIANGSRLEFAYQYGLSHFAKMPYLFRTAVVKNASAVTSQWTIMKRGIDTHINNFYDLFTD